MKRCLTMVLCAMLALSMTLASAEDFSFLEDMSLDQLIALRDAVDGRIDEVMAEAQPAAEASNELGEARGITFLKTPWGTSHELVAQHLQDIGFVDGSLGFGEYEIAVWPETYRSDAFYENMLGIGGRSVFLYPLKGIGGYEVFQVVLYYLYEAQDDTIVPNSHLTMVRVGLAEANDADMIDQLNQTYGPYQEQHDSTYIWYGEDNTAVAYLSDIHALYYAKTDDYPTAEALLKLKPEIEDAGL